MRALSRLTPTKSRSIPESEWNKNIDPKQASYAVKEYLTTAYGAATLVVPKFVSPSDPAAQWTGALKSAAFFAYADNHLIDIKSGSSWMSRPHAPFVRPRLARRKR
jgi:hypothetical protein